MNTTSVILCPREGLSIAAHTAIIATANTTIIHRLSTNAPANAGPVAITKLEMG